MIGAKTVLSLNLIQYTKINGGGVLYGLRALKRGARECVATPGVPACDWPKPQLHSFLAEYPSRLTRPQGGGRCPLRSTDRGGGPSGGASF